jgi:cell division protein FtsZ
MFKQGIKGVDFIVCNTDSQALQSSSVPNKIQLGVHLTEGLGAGANPDVGQQSAIESISRLKKCWIEILKWYLSPEWAEEQELELPVITISARRDILTVGIVTLPFLFEGKRQNKR